MKTSPATVRWWGVDHGAILHCSLCGPVSVITVPTGVDPQAYMEWEARAHVEEVHS